MLLRSVLGMACRAACPPAGAVQPPAAARLLSTCRLSLDAEQVVHGFSSPGNSGTSEEMKEVGRPEAVRMNEEAVQMHQFSEKIRFDEQQFQNPHQARGASAMPGDTGGEQALSERSAQTAEGQTHGVLHHSHETLRAARERGPGEYVDAASDMPEEKSAEEAAAVGEDVLPGSRGGVAPGQGRGYHTTAYATQGNQPPERTAAGVDPGVSQNPPKPELGSAYNPLSTPKPDTPDERAPSYEEMEHTHHGAAPADNPDGHSGGDAEDNPGQDEVMERRVSNPDVGGVAS